jgi:hypothetical protein
MLASFWGFQLKNRKQAIDLEKIKDSLVVDHVTKYFHFRQPLVFEI